MKDITFEQGPIRPPSEAGSLLLRFTRNCPWNRCAFCTVYKGKQFSRRSLHEIKSDIDAAAEIIEDLRVLSSGLGQAEGFPREALEIVFTSGRYNDFYRQAALWLYNGKGSVFIQDANSFVLPAGVISEAITHLKRKIPGITRITSYGRSSTLSKMGSGELEQIRKAGLDRVHVGMESGSDRVLKLIQKGVSAKRQVEAGKKVVEAGMELSEYIMPGLGGKEFSEEHARESARVLNEIDPHFIRLRSLRILSRADLHGEWRAGRFTPLHDDEAAAEIRLFISLLDGISSRVKSDHIMNLLEEVEGRLPEDKEKMLATIDSYLGMDDHDRLLFRLGRRGGALRTLGEIKDPAIRQRLETAVRDLAPEAAGDLEKLIKELADQYI
ncbi:MAG: radical SAM protein [Syntrophobacteraceae bacterium]|nr:radical SAM protein [Syntrophobacteraceae bacterium]